MLYNSIFSRRCINMSRVKFENNYRRIGSHNWSVVKCGTKYYLQSLYESLAIARNLQGESLLMYHATVWNADNCRFMCDVQIECTSSNRRLNF